MHENKLRKSSKDTGLKSIQHTSLRFLVLSWSMLLFGVPGFFIQLWLSFRVPDVSSLATEQFLFEISSRKAYLSISLFSSLVGLGWLALSYRARAKKIQSVLFIALLGVAIFILGFVGASLASSSISIAANTKQTNAITQSGLSHCTTVSLFSKRNLGGRGGSNPKENIVNIYKKDCSKILLDFKNDPHRRAVVMPLSKQKIQADYESKGLPLYKLCNAEIASWMDEFSSVSTYKWDLFDVAEFRVSCEGRAASNTD